MVLSFYWDDLKPEKQKEILALLGDNHNWNVFPFCTIDISKASSQKMCTDMAERNQEIFSQRQAGATYRSIAAKYGLSLERIRMICQEEGLNEKKKEDNDLIYILQHIIGHRLENGYISPTLKRTYNTLLRFWKKETEEQTELDYFMSLTENHMMKMYGMGKQGIELVLKGQDAIRQKMEKSTSVADKESGGHEEE